VVAGERVQVDRAVVRAPVPAVEGRNLENG
jgi:hypothetical protein